ncbi:acyl-CoA carboxylase subunit epsilon [Halostreptopolyspora alba]|uniref:Acyl-CoA carboxylase subunit epsilon n=1 Tax=Halostreptopolyspora alba TaxID=2487137 RepID=A0A3N0E3B8_9ACTN|nr:acyl-CoA carboxylase subunit epsilon [Nocardiopsaceae bacterium YIM 96095]
MTPTTPNTSEPDRHLRVVRGDPTPEEIASLVAVLSARARAARAARAAATDHRPRSGWRDRARLVRAPLRRGPSAWRATYGPG